MSTDNSITIKKSLDQLEEAARVITDAEGVPGRAHAIIREIQKSHIIAEAKRNYNRTGEYLPKHFKQKLAGKYNYSPKQIENIVYQAVDKLDDSQIDMFYSES